MPRYHFGSVDGHREDDPDGIELPDMQSARLEAIRFGGEVLKMDPELLWKHGQWRVEVTDDEGVLLFTVLTLSIDAPVPRETAAATA